jgi:hypothetical protein
MLLMAATRDHQNHRVLSKTYECYVCHKVEEITSPL